MSRSGIEEIINSNEFILVDKSSVNFAFSVSNHSNFEEKLKRKESQINSLNYWVDVFNNSSNDFKFKVTELGMREFKDFRKIKYKKAVKNSYCRGYLDYCRILKKENNLINEINYFFEKGNVLIFDCERKNVQSIILKDYKNEIDNFNNKLRKDSKSTLSETDLDYFSSAAVLNLEGKKISLITNDSALFNISGNFSKFKKEFDFDVYFHSRLGVFTKF
jgi:hypothetical protein